MGKPKSDSRLRWLKKASEILLLPKHRLESKKQSHDDIIKVNKRISKAYMELYLSKPTVFKWAGMASWASGAVGGGMSLTDSLWSYLANPADLSTYVSSEEVFIFLAVGNQALFLEIYWQHLAYLEGGIVALETVHSAGDLDGRALDAWKKIDSGVLTGNPKLIWDGNRDLLRYEQEIVLQENVYDRDRSLWERTSDLVDSPIPGHNEDFHDVVDGGDFGDFGDRWKYILESLLPAWKRWDHDFLSSPGQLARRDLSPLSQPQRDAIRVNLEEQSERPIEDASEIDSDGDGIPESTLGPDYEPAPGEIVEPSAQNSALNAIDSQPERNESGESSTNGELGSLQAHDDGVEIDDDEPDAFESSQIDSDGDGIPESTLGPDYEPAPGEIVEPSAQNSALNAIDSQAARVENREFSTNEADDSLDLMDDNQTNNYETIGSFNMVAGTAHATAIEDLSFRMEGAVSEGFNDGQEINETVDSLDLMNENPSDDEPDYDKEEESDEKSDKSDDEPECQTDNDINEGSATVSPSCSDTDTEKELADQQEKERQEEEEREKQEEREKAAEAAEAAEAADGPG